MSDDLYHVRLLPPHYWEACCTCNDLNIITPDSSRHLNLMRFHCCASIGALGFLTSFLELSFGVWDRVTCIITQSRQPVECLSSNNRWFYSVVDHLVISKYFKLYGLVSLKLYSSHISFTFQFSLFLLSFTASLFLVAINQPSWSVPPCHFFSSRLQLQLLS